MGRISDLYKAKGLAVPDANGTSAGNSTLVTDTGTPYALPLTTAKQQNPVTLPSPAASVRQAALSNMQNQPAAPVIPLPSLADTTAQSVRNAALTGIQSGATPPITLPTATSFSDGRTTAGGGRTDTGAESDASWLDVAKNAVYSGLNQFNSGLFKTLDFVLPTEFLGEHDVISNLNDRYSGLNDKYSKALEESTADKGTVAQVAGKLGAGTVAAVPNALLALMSGGTSAAAQGTTAGLEAASTAASSSGILSTASAAAQQLAKNPLYWSSFAQTLGTDYEEAKADGASEPEAIATAFISSLLNAGVEVSGGVETLPGALQSGSKSAIREWVKSALDEGKEEVVQGVISNLTQKAIYDQDKEYFSTTDQGAVVNPGRMAQEFGMGAAIGGILGGAQTALGKVQSGVFLPGSGLDVPVQTQQTTQNTPTAPTQTTTAPNVTTQAQDTTAQNTAFEDENADLLRLAQEIQAKLTSEAAVEGQKNTVSTGEAAVNAAVEKAKAVLNAGIFTGEYGKALEGIGLDYAQIERTLSDIAQGTADFSSSDVAAVMNILNGTDVTQESEPTQVADSPMRNDDTEGLKEQNIHFEPEMFEDSSVDGFGKNTVGSAQARFQYQEAPTQSVANDMFTEEEAEAHPELGGTTHKVYTNAESRTDAQERLAYDYEYEKAALESEEWGAAETVMGYEVLRDLTEAARESGDYSEVVAWKKMFDQKGTTAGQALQARKQFVEKPDYIIAEAAETLEGDNIRKMTDERKQKILDTVREQADAFDALEEGDTAALIDLIKRNNEIRRTTGLFSKKTAKSMNWALNKVTELYPETAEDFLRNVALSQIRSISSDYQKISPLEAVKNYRIIGMLSKTSTVMRNLVSNNVFDPLESLSNNVGIVADALISKATGNRTTAVDKSWFSEAKRSGSLEGALKSYIQVGLDADVDGATSRYETSSGRTFKMTGNPLERLLSTWSKYENYALKTTDEFQKGGIDAETQRGIDKLKSAGKLDVEALPDWASETAKQRTFQNDGAVANTMVGLRSAANNLSIKDSLGGSLGVGDVMLPFAKVPGNLVAQAANYSPLGLANSFREITGVLIDAKKGNVSAEKQAQAARDFGRGVTGTGLLAGFAALAAMGLIDVAGDDDADKEALETAQGRTGTQWNLSATLRAIKGESTEWQDDDTLLAIGFLDPINAIMAAGALLADSYEEEGRVTAKGVGSASLGAVIQAMMDLPAVSSISSLMDAYKYSDSDTVAGKAGNAILEYGASQASSFLLPNFLKGIATGTDDTVRNQYAGETWQEDAVNSVKAGLPMLRETLPPSLDSFGREKTYTGNSLLDFLNANILPGQVTKYNQTELEKEIERLNSETGATNIYPDKSAPTSVSYDSEKYVLTPEERYAYQQNCGQIAEDLMYAMAESGSYKSATDEEKAEMMNDTLSFAEDLAKREFLASRNVDYESSSWEKAYKIVDAGIDFSVYLEYKDQLSELKEASNTSTANSEIRRKIFSDSRLTQNQKSVLDETILSDGIYIPKDVNVDYSSDESFTISQMSESAQKRWPSIKEKFTITAEQYVEAWSIYNQDGVSATEKKAALRELVGATQGNRLYTEFGKDLD